MNVLKNKTLLILAVLSLMGCVTKQTPRAAFKREYKENRFTKQFQEADSMFNQKYK